MGLKGIFIGAGTVLLGYLWLVFAHIRITGMLIKAKPWRRRVTQG